MPAAPAPSPWDAAYEQSVANARNKYANTLTALGYQRQRADQDYGLAPGFNDYQSNPYSRAAVLEQSFQRSNRGSTNSLASAGQLYAGSLSNALNSNRAAYGQNRDALERSYRDALQDLEQQRLGAENEMAEGIADAMFQKNMAAANADLEPETAPVEASSPAGGGGGKPKSKSKAKQKAPQRKSAIHQAVAQNRALRGGRR